MAETLHQRLVRPADGNAPLSVHLCDYPEPEPRNRDDELRRAMGLARDVVALGLKVRAAHKIRVRQPLAEATVVLAGGEELDRFADAIREELNVHTVRASDDPFEHVEFTVVPNFRALGPKLGKRMPLCKQALQKADGSALYRQLDAEGRVTLALGEGDPVELTRDEVEIRITAHEGFAAASEGGRVVVLDTRITPELRREGLAREVINRIQTARKAMDLPYEARIEIAYRAEGELAEAIAAHAAWIAKETLATSLRPGDPEGERHESEVEGADFVFAIQR